MPKGLSFLTGKTRALGTPSRFWHSLGKCNTAQTAGEAGGEEPENKAGTGSRPTPAARPVGEPYRPASERASERARVGEANERQHIERSLGWARVPALRTTGIAHHHHRGRGPSLPSDEMTLALTTVTYHTLRLPGLRPSVARAPKHTES